MSGYGNRVLSGHRWSLGTYRFTFYPRLVTVGNGGIYTAQTNLFQYPNSLVPDIETSDYYTRFSSLSYHKPPDVIQTKGDLALLSGNQFFFKGNSVYSWWGSPCGDGPEENVSYSEVFNYPARYVWKDSAPIVIYKDGNVWASLRANYYFATPYDNLYYKIAGVFVGSVTIGQTTQRRLVIATYQVGSFSCELSIKAFKKDENQKWTLAGSYLVSTGIDKQLLWPLRFNSIGTECSVIYKKQRVEEGIGTVVYQTLDTLSLSYGESSLSVASQKTLTDEPKMTATEYSTIYRDINVSFSRTPFDEHWDVFTQNTTATLHQEHLVEQVFSPTFAKLPIALNYNQDHQLKVLYVTVNHEGSYGDSSFYNETATSTMIGICDKETSGVISIDSYEESSTWSSGSSHGYQCTIQLVNNTDEVLVEFVLATDNDSSSGSGTRETQSGSASIDFSERRVWFYYLDALTQSYFYETLCGFKEATGDGGSQFRTHALQLTLQDESRYGRDLTSDIETIPGNVQPGGVYAGQVGSEVGVALYHGRSYSEVIADETNTYFDSEPVNDFTLSKLFFPAHCQTEIEYSIVIDHRIQVTPTKQPAWAYSFYINYTNTANGTQFDGILSRFEYVFNSDGFMAPFVPLVLCQGTSSFGDLYLKTPTYVGGVKTTEFYEPHTDLVFHPIGLI